MTYWKPIDMWRPLPEGTNVLLWAGEPFIYVTVNRDPDIAEAITPCTWSGVTHFAVITEPKLRSDDDPMDEQDKVFAETLRIVREFTANNKEAAERLIKDAQK